MLYDSTLDETLSGAEKVCHKFLSWQYTYEEYKSIRGLESARKIDAEGKGDEFMELLCELQEDERELNGDCLELEQASACLWLGFERIQERLNMEVENG